MDNLPMSGPDGQDLKSFWGKPEGKATLLLLAGVGCVVFYFWGLIVPFVVATLANTLYAGILFGVIALLVFLLTNKQVRTMVWYLWRTFMRFMVGLVIQIDPIAILKSYIADLEDKARTLFNKISELAGAEEKLGAKIRKNDEDADTELQTASKAKSMGKADAAQLHAMKAAGLKSMNEKLLPLYGNMQRLHAFLDRAYKASDLVVRQAKIQVELKEAEYDAIKTGSKALRSAMSVFKGDPDKRAMFEQSIDYINDDMAKKVGEMKRIMEFSAEFIDNADIETGVSSDKGMALLDDYEKRLSIFTQPAGASAQPSLSSSLPIKDSIGMSSPAPVPKKSEWE